MKTSPVDYFLCIGLIYSISLFPLYHFFIIIFVCKFRSQPTHLTPFNNLFYTILVLLAGYHPLSPSILLLVVSISSSSWLRRRVRSRLYPRLVGSGLFFDVYSAQLHMRCHFDGINPEQTAPFAYWMTDRGYIAVRR